MVISAVKDVTLDCLAKDLGNGYDKQTIDGEEVTVEPAVFAHPTDFFQIDESDTKQVSVNKQRPIYIGQDAIESGRPLKSALGESDSRRYYSDDYKNLLFGSIGKNMMANTKIKMLVLGLPNKHYQNEKIREDLQEMVRGKNLVQVGNIEMVIETLNSFVMPQPIGTVVYLHTEGYDFNGQILVCDGGYGTFDLSVVKGTSVVDYQQKDLGMKQAYKEIAKILETKLDLEFKINEIPIVLKQGIPYGREVIYPLEKFPEIRNIMNSHFEELYQFIVDCYGNPKRFSAIVWTGGIAPAHEERIKEMDERTKNYNSLVLQNGQVANVLGFHAFGLGLIESAV